MFDENVAGQADDVLLNEGRAVSDEIQPVGREEVFELEAVDAGGVGFFDVKIILIIVVRIDDADAKRRGVPEGAVVDAVHVKVAHHGEIAVNLEQSVNEFQRLVEFAHLGAVVDDGVPERGCTFVIREWDYLLKSAEAFVSDGEIALAFVATQVAEQIWADGKSRFFPRQGVGHSGRMSAQGKDVY